MAQPLLHGEFIRHLYVLLFMGCMVVVLSHLARVSKNLTDAEIGAIYAINSGAAMIIMFIYSVIEDKLSIKRNLVIILSARQVSTARTAHNENAFRKTVHYLPSTFQKALVSSGPTSAFCIISILHHH